MILVHLVLAGVVWFWSEIDSAEIPMSVWGLLRFRRGFPEPKQLKLAQSSEIHSPSSSCVSHALIHDLHCRNKLSGSIRLGPQQNCTCLAHLTYVIVWHVMQHRLGYKYCLHPHQIETFNKPPYFLTDLSSQLTGLETTRHALTMFTPLYLAAIDPGELTKAGMLYEGNYDTWRERIESMIYIHQLQAWVPVNADFALDEYSIEENVEGNAKAHALISSNVSPLLLLRVPEADLQEPAH